MAQTSADDQIRFCRVAWACWLSLGGLLSGALSLPAAESPEQCRDFRILVDGKERGTFHMKIRQDADGTEVMAGEADLLLNYIVYRYRYTSRGAEKWKDGRLLHLENVANYNGSQYTVKAVALKNELNLSVNGEERRVNPEVWPTSYWRLPNPKFRNRDVPLLDTDKGRDLKAELQYVGLKPLNLEGRVQQCAHYRVRGGVQVDLWYDGQDRLVRQESLESGHRTVLELTQIQN
jgi:hypothetical protein